MIPSPTALIVAIDALNEIGAPYILTGSIVSNSFSEPRATRDADFVISATKEQITKLRERLSEHFVAEPQMAFETVTGKTMHKFRERGSKFLIEIFEADLSDAHERARFDRRWKRSLVGREAYFTTAEDVVIQKLRWYARLGRDKDVKDVHLVLFHQWETLDWSYVEHWCDEHGTRDVLREAKKVVEEMLDG